MKGKGQKIKYTEREREEKRNRGEIEGKREGV
jgi:hypothetical protein